MYLRCPSAGGRWRWRRPCDLPRRTCPRSVRLSVCRSVRLADGPCLLLQSVTSLVRPADRARAAGVIRQGAAAAPSGPTDCSCNFVADPAAFCHWDPSRKRLRSRGLSFGSGVFPPTGREQRASSGPGACNYGYYMIANWERMAPAVLKGMLQLANNCE